MPVSQGSAGGLPGMNLKAWVVITPAGAVVKSSNVSGVVRNSAGNYTVTFTAAMNGTDYVGVLSPGGASIAGLFGMSTIRNTGSATCVSSYSNAGSMTPLDCGGLWAFYE